MGNYQTVQFKVLPDKCSAEDLLEDHTHELIAGKLCEIISAEGPEGMTVGLEGEWGSGKSTVVRLLQEKLNKVGKTFVFYIDAWEHEGDHLRRVFLETLIEKIKAWREWGDDEVARLNNIADRITSKKTSKKIVHSSQMTGFGKCVAFAALLVPLGASLLSVFAERVTTEWTGLICWEFWVSVVFTMAPVWVYAWRGLINIFRASQKKFSLFETEAKVDTIYETSREEERSSVEFERYFGEILQTVSSEINKIVMVIDNLDRINPEDALRIWSTLQAFVQSKNPVPTKTDKLCKWIIVPYAHEGLQRIWEEFKEPNGTEKINRSSSFMDKSFQLRLHVPKMVISGWKSFAKRCLKEAAEELDCGDVGKVLDVLSWTRKNLTDAPSPRQVKVYINQVGVVCSLHGKRLPLEAICFYVVKKYLCGLSDRRIEKELREGAISKASLPQYEHNENLASEVAAILYGVEEKRAMQILLEPVITAALRASDSELLIQMRETHGDVFYDVLNYVLHNTKGEDMPKFAAAIQKAFADVDTVACGHALNSVRLHRDTAVKQMESLCQADAVAVIALASVDKQLVNGLAGAYALELPLRFRNDRGVTPRLGNKVEYVDSSVDLLKYFSDVSHAAKETIAIPYKAFKDANVDLSKFSLDELRQLAGYMSGKDDAEEDVAEQIQEGKPIPEWAVNLFDALTSNGMVETRQVLDAVSRAFAWNNGQRGNGIYGPPHWNILLAMEHVDRALRPVDEIKALLHTKGFWLFNDFPNNQTIFMLGKYHGELSDQELLPSGVHSNRVARYRQLWDIRDHDRGRSIYRYASYSHEFDWLAAESAKESRSLVGDVAEAALDANDPYLFKVERPFGFFADLFRWVDDEHHLAMVESFISDEARLTKLSESGGEKLVDHPSASRELLSSIAGREVCVAIIRKIKSELIDMTQEEWTSVFNAPNGMAELVGWLIQNGERLDLANPFAEAFKSYVCGRIQSATNECLQVETLEVLHKAMKPVLRGVFAAGIGEVLKAAKFNVATADIKEFVLMFPDYGEWLESTHVSVKNMAAELAKLEHIWAFDNFISIIGRCGDDLPNMDEIKDIIEQPVLTMLKNEDPQVCGIGNKAAACFGIEPSSEEEAEVRGSENDH